MTSIENNQNSWKSAKLAFESFSAQWSSKRFRKFGKHGGRPPCKPTSTQTNQIITRLTHLSSAKHELGIAQPQLVSTLNILPNSIQF